MKKKEKQEIPYKMTGPYTSKESPKLFLGMKNYSVTKPLSS